MKSSARHSQPATKDDLSNLEFRMGLKFDDFERKILDQVRLIRDEILTSNDKVVKELDDIRVNYQVSSGISEEVREKVENHEKRITKLENN